MNKEDAIHISCVYTHTCTHTHNGILINHKKGNNAMCSTWMDLETIILSGVNQKEKGKNI